MSRKADFRKDPETGALIFTPSPELRMIQDLEAAVKALEVQVEAMSQKIEALQKQIAGHDTGGN